MKGVENGGGGGGEVRLQRGPSEGGHSEDRSSGFQQVAEVKFVFFLYTQPFGWLELIISQIYVLHYSLQVQLRFLTEEEKRARLEEGRLKSESSIEVLLFEICTHEISNFHFREAIINKND